MFSFHIFNCCIALAICCNKPFNLLLDDINPLPVYFVQQIRIDMFVESDDINGTLEKVFKEAFQSDHHISFRLHVDTNVHVATFMLLVS